MALNVPLYKGKRSASFVCLCERKKKEKGTAVRDTYHNSFWPWQGLLVPFWNGAAVDEHVRPCAEVEAGRIRQDCFF